MTTEKLSKAYFWRSGDPPKKSHIGFATFMRRLHQVPKPQRQRIADIFGFSRFDGFQGWSYHAMPLVYALERLAPALADDGPNPEYPWPQDSPQHVPATFDFDVWQQLAGTANGRRLIQVITAAGEQFPVYG